MKITVQLKVYAVFIFSFLVLMAISAAAYSKMKALVVAVREAVELQETLRDVQYLHELVKDSEIGAQGFLLTGKQRYLKPYLESKSQIPAQLETLKKKTIADQETRKTLISLEKSLREKFDDLQKSVIARDDGLSDALQIVFKGDGRRLLLDINDLISRVEARHASLLQGQARLAARGFEDLIQTIGQTCLVTVLVFLVTMILVRHDFKLVRKYEKELIEAREAALSASAHKSSFLANMSHEIRTPLNGIIGTWELLKTTPLNDEQKAYGSSIHDSAQILAAIVNNILDLSKIESGKIELEKIDFDLRKILREVANSFVFQVKERGNALQLFMMPGMPVLLAGDPTKIKQVLLNLIGNAAKFTENGKISVRASGAFEEGSSRFFLRIEVEDTGVGIPASARATIFDSFTQADASTTRKFGGSGLGLSIAKRLAVLMGGTIDFESKVGIGTKFWFKIPVESGAKDGFVALDAAVAEKNAPLSHEPPVVIDARAELEEVALADPQGVADGSVIELFEHALQRRVLVVEDNPMNQKMMFALLKKMGLEVSVAKNGYEALKKIVTDHFDLIFMDCHMPGIDGYETARRVRGYEHKRGLRFRTPIVALTAQSLQEDEKRCTESGMDDFIAKPIDLTTLRQTLRKWLKGENVGVGGDRAREA